MTASPGSPGIRVAVVGGSGHTGGEACRLLLNHPAVAEIVPTSRTDDPFERVHPNLLGSGLEFVPVEEVVAAAARFDAVLLCTPSGEAMRLAPLLLDAGTRVIDLSADFRFPDPERYRAAHDREHTAPGLLGEAVYGVTEFARDRVRTARLVANPGCYAITALLGLAPLLGTGLARPDTPLHIAAVNGTTGAGVTPRTAIQHAEVVGSLLPYNLAGHRHAPELEERFAQLAGAPVAVDLSTAHGDFARGIHIQASVQLRPGRRDGVSRESLLALYREHYGEGSSGEYFVRVNDQPSLGGPTDKDYGRFPHLAAVAGSNFVHIGLDHDARLGIARVVAVSDNLVKGAAGSAVQNLNVMLGLAETDGLLGYGL
ncbi:N-acetyl-gamma-glutamyl-phosphate reductase [Streptomyces sp. NPDC102451]|uniref:N-acetyl-gamma-glutamyl-phosphate reductase n=1 Tax=Streptomyces sp. NPDC102451 TaxID=3366177 RepID=UPI00381A4B10